jgi:hypothetical protein
MLFVGMAGHEHLCALTQAQMKVVRMTYTFQLELEQFSLSDEQSAQSIQL